MPFQFLLLQILVTVAGGIHGYNAIPISTIVDFSLHPSTHIGYNAIPISTIVDWQKTFQRVLTAIMPFQFLLLQIYETKQDGTLAIMPFQFLLLQMLYSIYLILTGYNAIPISTIVDPSLSDSPCRMAIMPFQFLLLQMRDGSHHLPVGYNAIPISTIVDPQLPRPEDGGYNAIPISTIVDPLYLPHHKLLAIMPFQFLLLQISFGLRCTDLAIMPFQFLLLQIQAWADPTTLWAIMPFQFLLLQMESC